MRKTRFVAVLFSCSLVFPAHAQDRAAAVPDMQVLLENDSVRMQFHDVAVGESTPMHSHPGYAVYVFDPYRARITLPDGSQRISEHKAGDAFWNDASRHVVQNIGATPIHNLVVELKPAADAAATRAAYDAYVHDFWSDGDAGAAERALSPALVYHYNGAVIPGDLQAHRDALRQFRAEVPDLKAVTDVYTGSGAHGAAATTWTGTYAGKVCGKQVAEPVKLRWAVNYLFRVEQGRIVELWETWDEGPLYRKLGIGPGACEAAPGAPA